MPEALEEIAGRMAAAGKGILAADESTGTISRRFEAIELESTGQTRRDWRELLFRCREALSEHISGVILFEETLRQKTADGRTALPGLIEAAGALPGIKVDKGAKPMALSAEEKVTEGLDGLRERLADYRGLGARFAKWRAVIGIGAGLPGRGCIAANAEALARYAALCQEAGLVPIVEPEVLMDGAHDIGRCLEVSREVLGCVFEALALHRVRLEGIILKPNMVLPGQACPARAEAGEVAGKTLQVLHEKVPHAVPGIAFLSGGSRTRRRRPISMRSMRGGMMRPGGLRFLTGAPCRRGRCGSGGAGRRTGRRRKAPLPTGRG